MTDNLFKSKTARSIFYIAFIGGLLSLTSLTVMLVWNYSISVRYVFPHISFLEACGAVAFVYVVYFGVKFGTQGQKDTSSATNADIRQTTDNMSTPSPKLKPDLLKNISSEEKKELTEFVNRCCGYSNVRTSAGSFTKAEKQGNI